MKQTTVEWLLEKLTETHTNDEWKEIIRQAKEMEKDQICEAYAIGGSPLLGPWEFGEEYYNNTFKSE